jgi:hypothetical protein
MQDNIDNHYHSSGVMNAQIWNLSVQELMHLWISRLMLLIHYNSKYDLANNHVHCKLMLSLRKMMQHLLGTYP